MTYTERIHMLLLFSAAAFILSAMWQHEKQKHSCSYCGIYRGHEPHCPYERIDNHD